jgi:DNA-binding response OmpR family regulator
VEGLHANQSSSGAKRAGYGSGPLVNNVSLFRKRRLAFAGIITGDRQLTSYRFGKFDFLSDERRLKKAGKEIPLGARAFDLLIFLVENRHRVVTKAEMLDAVWPDIAVE